MMSRNKGEDFSSSSIEQTGLVDISEEPIPNFSIRNCVFASRSKGEYANNWPFCTKFLKMCLKAGIKDPLPPFDHPSSNPNLISSNDENHRFLVSMMNKEQNSTPNLGKLFPSPTNMKLNFHIDQCLSKRCNMNISNCNNRIQNVEAQMIKYKVKPRKKKSLMEIYASAKHGTIQDLDKRNGTNWATGLARDILPREKSNYQEVQEEKIYANGCLRNCQNEEGVIYFDSKGVKIRILSKLSDEIKNAERVEKKKRIGSEVLKFKKLKYCEKKHARSKLLKIIESKQEGDTKIENSNSSKFTKKPLSDVSHFQISDSENSRVSEGIFVKSAPKRKLKEISLGCKTTPDLEKELEKISISSRTFRKQRSRTTKRKINIQSENNHCLEKREKDGIITKLPLEEEEEVCGVRKNDSLVPNMDNSRKKGKNIATEYNGITAIIDRPTIYNCDSEQSQEGPHRSFAEKTEEIKANKSPVFSSWKDSSSKLRIGPRTNSPFTSYQKQNSNPNTNLNIASPNSNSTVRLMGKDLTINSSHQGAFMQYDPNHGRTSLDEFIASDNSMSHKNQQFPFPYMMVQPNFGSMQRITNYSVGASHIPFGIHYSDQTSRVLFHLNPNFYYST